MLGNLDLKDYVKRNNLVSEKETICSCSGQKNELAMREGKRRGYKFMAILKIDLYFPILHKIKISGGLGKELSKSCPCPFLVTQQVRDSVLLLAA